MIYFVLVIAGKFCFTPVLFFERHVLLLCTMVTTVKKRTQRT